MNLYLDNIEEIVHHLDTKTFTSLLCTNSEINKKFNTSRFWEQFIKPRVPDNFDYEILRPEMTYYEIYKLVSKYIFHKNNIFTHFRMKHNQMIFDELKFDRYCFREFIFHNNDKLFHKYMKIYVTKIFKPSVDKNIFLSLIDASIRSNDPKLFIRIIKIINRDNVYKDFKFGVIDFKVLILAYVLCCIRDDKYDYIHPEIMKWVFSSKLKNVLVVTDKIGYLLDKYSFNLSAIYLINKYYPEQAILEELKHIDPFIDQYETKKENIWNLSNTFLNKIF